MSTTDNLALTLIETSQAQKEVTANQAFAALDAAICESLTFEVGDGANEPTEAQVREAVRILLVAGSPAPSGAVTVTLPAVKRLLFVSNDCGETADIECDGGSETVEVADGASVLVYCDGIEVYGISSGGGSAPVALGTYVAGVPLDDEVVLSFVATDALAIPVALAGSRAVASVAATAETDFDVQKNGSSVGTIRFAAAGTVATFIAASAVSIAAGDRLSVVAPSTADATLADISITIRATRE